MPTKREVPEFRRCLGILLRAPVVLLAGAIWVLSVWWWIAGFSITITLGVLVLHPIAYPVLFILEECRLAYLNSGDPVLPNYWKDYPECYLNWCRKYITLGFPVLCRWLLEGER
jgi:hypothetical protein